MKRIVTTDDATGTVLSQWRGGDEQTLEPVTGRTHRPVLDDATDCSGQRWNGTTFVRVPPSAPTSDPLTDHLLRLETKLDQILSR